MEASRRDSGLVTGSVFYSSCFRVLFLMSSLQACLADEPEPLPSFPPLLEEHSMDAAYYFCPVSSHHRGKFQGFFLFESDQKVWFVQVCWQAISVDKSKSVGEREEVWNEHVLMDSHLDYALKRSSLEYSTLFYQWNIVEFFFLQIRSTSFPCPRR